GGPGGGEARSAEQPPGEMDPSRCAHSSVERVCGETYGVILYQEQVMSIAVLMAGYSPGQADNLRKAMGKKSREVMQENREPFVEGAMANGIDAGIAARVFEQIAEFAEYAFNKSHSAAYAVLAYQTAYLKVHHPVEFLAALLTCDRDDTDRVVRYISEARSSGIDVLGPDINESQADFTVVERPEGGRGTAVAGRGSPVAGAIRFGLSAVKGVGGAALEAIIEARTEGPFTDLFDFCSRVDMRRVNRSVLEALIKAGAFDGTSVPVGISRAGLLANLDRAIEFGRARRRDREVGQQGLFDLLDGGGSAPAGGSAAGYAQTDEWDEMTLLRMERDSIGAYLSGHPLHRFEDDVRRYASAAAAEVEDKPIGTTVCVGGMVEGLQERLSRKTGRRTAVFHLEDLTGAVETFVPPQALDRFEAVLRSGRPVLCTGKVESSAFRDAAGGQDGEDESVRFVLTEARTFAEVRQERTRVVRIRVDAASLDDRGLSRLRSTLEANRGPCPAYLHIAVPNRGETVVALPERCRVDPTDDLVAAVARDFGPGRIELA
ncbi:MAG: DNA polymerase III subunit alpha, partial [Myxococcota bacterium]|nr:DNA polymerase III subunit alpha [Myxococcota bacterium]